MGKLTFYLQTKVKSTLVPRLDLPESLFLIRDYLGDEKYFYYATPETKTAKIEIESSVFVKLFHILDAATNDQFFWIANEEVLGQEECELRNRCMTEVPSSRFENKEVESLYSELHTMFGRAVNEQGIVYYLDENQNV